MWVIAQQGGVAARQPSPDGSLNLNQLLVTRQNTHQGKPCGVPVGGFYQGLTMGLGLVLGNLEKGLRKQGFARDWMLPGSRGNFMTGILVNLVKWEWNKAMLKL